MILGRCRDGKTVTRQLRLNAAAQERCQRERFRPYPLHARLVVEGERPCEWCHAQHVWRPELQCPGIFGWRQCVRHVELAGLVRGEPSRQTRPHAPMPPVQVKTADRARPGVQVFVVAPEGKVRTPIVQSVRTAPMLCEQSQPMRTPRSCAARSPAPGPATARSCRRPRAGRPSAHRASDAR